MAIEVIVPYDPRNHGNPWGQLMKTVIEDFARTHDLGTPFVTRRRLLFTASPGFGFASLIRTQDVFSMADEENGMVQQTASEHARRESLPSDAYDLPQWVPEHTGPYDLSDPYDNHFAFAKAHANLSGDYYWLAQYG